MNEEEQNRSGLEIAVIGMACRLPGAPDLNSFWSNLRNGVESIRRFTHEELESFGRRPEEVRTKGFVPAHGALDGIDKFDAKFFGFSPREAEIMDPQHRVFLETVWEAIENAGYTPETYDGVVGVFAGCSANDYLYANIMQNRSNPAATMAYQTRYSNLADFLSTRVSYKLGLQGPSFSVQSACSTSLVAIHVACQQLLSGACDMAVTGGASITLPQHWGYQYQEGMILSPDGHCRTFDANASGTLGGSGVGAVILKRLADAIEDGDSIDAVILGSAINNDGDAKVGYSAPGVTGQTEVIRSAQIMANASPDSISYIEAHGTGTPMGDPIEMSALTQAFREETNRQQFCALGSVKTNFGHLDAAAGVAGFIKTVLALKHKTLPASLHFKQPNPEIDFSNSPFYVNDRCSEWKSNGAPRRAGVSSFGIGGTNAHVILEEAPAPSAHRKADQSHYSLIPLSARSATALENMTGALKQHLQNNREQELPDVAFTLQHGRKNFDHRRIMVARTGEELASKMDSGNPGSTDRTLGSPNNVVFLFTGQGSQYLNMARGLYEEDRDFRQDIDQCAEILLPHLNEDIRQCLYPSSDENNDALSARLTCTDMAQPAIFTVEYALARYWMRIGVKPSALIGHSLGELTAACVAGVFSLEDALKLVALRGRLMQSMPPGTMAAVPLPPATVSPYLENKLSLAAINTPSVCVVSGPKEEMEQLQAKMLSDHDLDCRQLHTSHAFHSHMMDPTVQPFREAVSACSTHPAQIPIISTITGRPLGSQETQDTEYWAKNIRETVHYADAVGQIIQRDNTILIEIGPGNTLITLAKNHPDKTENLRCVTSLRHPQQKVDDMAHLLTSVGQLWVAGLSVDWDQLNPGEKRQRVHLPSYPFERERHWIDPDPIQPVETPIETPTLEVPKPKHVKNIADWFYIPSWKRSTLSSMTHSQEESKKAQRWLIFMDETGIADQFIHRLREEYPNSDVTCVRFGAEFNHLSENTFTIRPEQPDDFDQVFAYLIKADRTPDQILYYSLLFDDASENCEFLTPEKSELIQTYGFFSLLYISRALFHNTIEHSVSLSVISDKHFAVIGDETICPDKMTAQAIVMVLPTELRTVRTRIIDIAKEPASGKFSQRDLNGVYNEILLDRGDKLILAYRHGSRWQLDSEKISLEEVDRTPHRLRTKGVYLVTGGLGGIGLTIARYLAESFQAHLVLVGRQGLPPRAEWGSWINTHGESDPMTQKIRAVEDLERLGAKVQVHSTDVSDEAAMAKVIAETNQSFGKINGVIHAAGIYGGGIIATLEKEDVKRFWSAKVEGTRVLISLLREASPDFILLCSSLNSIIGQPGGVSYTASNLYLDGVAQQQFTKQGMPVININWDGWGEVGMLVAAESKGGVKDPRDEDFRIYPKDGIEIFKRVVDQGLPQIFVYTGMQSESPKTSEFSKTTEAPAKSKAGSQPKVEHQPKAEDQGETLVADSIQSSPNKAKETPLRDDDPRTEVEIKMIRIWQKVLGVNRIGINDNFFELGGDSVMGVQVMALSTQAGIHFTPKQLFNNQTVAELAKAVEVLDYETVSLPAIQTGEDDSSHIAESDAIQNRVNKHKKRFAGQRKRITTIRENQE
jgi:acyl transferase domain-containing protein/NAD(P)-dependent dehydrogenase (short-subunit alcohol dehydrogenase family)/acyl carrier protein